MAKSRNYDREMALRTQADIDDQNSRHKARRKMINKLGAAALAGKDVHHRNGIDAGNGSHNLAVMNRSRNRRQK